MKITGLPTIKLITILGTLLKAKFQPSMSAGSRDQLPPRWQGTTGWGTAPLRAYWEDRPQGRTE